MMTKSHKNSRYLPRETKGMSMISLQVDQLSRSWLRSKEQPATLQFPRMLQISVIVLVMVMLISLHMTK
uniref:Uncharacterized protein n=1 Tax=Salix viminalis TaxID=40686 RepID=A0A6N2MIP4_SALVM